MEEYKPNSHKSREESQSAEPVKKVIKNQAQFKKKNEAQKLADIFIAEDMENVKSYIIHDLLVPGVKNIFFNIVSDGLSMMLFNDTKARDRNSSSKRVYTEYYGDRDRSVERDRSGSSYDYHNVSFDSEVDANDVLDQMCELIDLRGEVSVADLYDLAGLRSNKYTDNRYGWKDLRTAQVARDRDGYYLKLPRVRPI